MRLPIEATAGSVRAEGGVTLDALGIRHGVLVVAQCRLQHVSPFRRRHAGTAPNARATMARLPLCARQSAKQYTIIQYIISDAAGCVQIRPVTIRPDVDWLTDANVATFTPHRSKRARSGAQHRTHTIHQRSIQTLKRALD